MDVMISPFEQIAVDVMKSLFEQVDAVMSPFEQIDVQLLLN